jgi:hypothetical protein
VARGGTVPQDVDIGGVGEDSDYRGHPIERVCFEMELSDVQYADGFFTLPWLVAFGDSSFLMELG